MVQNRLVPIECTKESWEQRGHQCSDPTDDASQDTIAESLRIAIQALVDSPTKSPSLHALAIAVSRSDGNAGCCNGSAAEEFTLSGRSDSIE